MSQTLCRRIPDGCFRGNRPCRRIRRIRFFVSRGAPSGCRGFVEAHAAQDLRFRGVDDQDFVGGRAGHAHDQEALLDAGVGDGLAGREIQVQFGDFARFDGDGRGLGGFGLVRALDRHADHGGHHQKDRDAEADDQHP